MAVAGAALLLRTKPQVRIDILAAALLAGSLVKPQLSVPLVVAALVATGRMRPVLLTGLIYGGRVEPMGVAAIVARFWAHSMAYDDVLLLLPAAALMRIAYTVLPNLMVTGDRARIGKYA